ncbi:MAG: hypothetical protein P0S94_00225, partial [Simkaniaceae bacterium]|nr:hypothetical protein [Simkaniaceae bacterium]
LEKKYAAKLAEFYSNDELKKLTNPSFHRLMGFIKTRNNPLQSWRDQLDFDTSNQVFCSEFTAKSLLKAFVELEKEIRSDLKDEAFELEPPINMWRRIGNVFASTLWKKRGDERYQFHNAPQIIQQLFELPKAR